MDRGAKTADVGAVVALFAFVNAEGANRGGAAVQSVPGDEILASRADVGAGARGEVLFYYCLVFGKVGAEGEWDGGEAHHVIY